MVVKRPILLVLVLIHLTPVASQAVAQTMEVEVSVDRTEITTSETVTLTLQVSTLSTGRIVSSLPLGVDFRVVNEFQSFSTNSQYNRIFFLSPTRAGTLTIGPITVQLQGYLPVTRRTDPITIIVTDSSDETSSDPLDTDSGPTPGPDSGERMVIPDQADPERPFLAVSVSADPVYVGEQLTVDYELFEPMHRPWDLVGIRQPAFNDLWFEAVPSDTVSYERHTMSVNGVTYRSQLVGRYVVVPLGQGSIQVAPIQVSVTESIFGQLEIESESPTIEARPLPPAAPSGFSPNNTGHYDFTIQIQEQGHRVGDSIRVVLRVSGTGLVSLVDVPALEVSGANVLPPIESRDQRLRGGRIGGSKEVEYVVIPTAEGALSIGPLTFHYFDPTWGEYETVEVQAHTMTISGFNPHADLISGEEEPEIVELLANMARPRDTSGSALELSLPQPLVWALAGFPPFFLLVFGVGTRLKARRRRLEAVRLKRGAHRQAKQVIRRAKRAETATASGEIAEAMRIYLQNRMDIRARALTENEMVMELTGTGVSTQTARTLTDLLSKCEAARFGSNSEDTTPGALAEAALAVLKKLEASA